ncbi:MULTISPECIES: hypothetical protein [unclassified Rhizobium]|uniref:hypothetical protein n=1 Tax=unclassified Rhizobium TaxID=2613769 RepID=UPI001FD864F2|nr:MULTISPECIES: hypothetical protein [unclassified Rhizobium]
MSCLRGIFATSECRHSIRGNIDIGLYVVYPPARHLALKVRVLVDYLVTAFRGQPKWDDGWR